MWLLFIFIPLAFPFVFAPIIVRFSNSHPASPVFDVAGVGQLPPDVADNFARFVYTMSAEGFVFVGYFRQMSYMPGVGFYLALLKNPVTADMVYLIDIFANNGITRLRAATVEFCTDYSD